MVGWSMETHLRTELVLVALNMAIWRRPEAVIRHSGSEYERAGSLGVRAPCSPSASSRRAVARRPAPDPW